MNILKLLKPVPETAEVEDALMHRVMTRYYELLCERECVSVDEADDAMRDAIADVLEQDIKKAS